jgi:hypothetical protein
MRKLIAFLCLAAVLWAAFTPASVSLLWALLVPFFSLAWVLAVSLPERRPEHIALPQFSDISTIVSRAPPCVGTLA